MQLSILCDSLADPPIPPSFRSDPLFRPSPPSRSGNSHGIRADVANCLLSNTTCVAPTVSPFFRPVATTRHSRVSFLLPLEGGTIARLTVIRIPPTLPPFEDASDRAKSEQTRLCPHLMTVLHPAFFFPLTFVGSHVLSFRFRAATVTDGGIGLWFFCVKARLYCDFIPPVRKLGLWFFPIKDYIACLFSPDVLSFFLVFYCALLAQNDR